MICTFVFLDLILIANGFTNNGRSTSSIEIINLNGCLCQDFAFDQDLMGHVGQVLDCNKVVLCGGLNHGHDISYRCFQVNRSGTFDFATMIDRRYYAASVLLDSKEMWILGGTDRWREINSTEIVLSNQSVFMGPDMPIPLKKHSITQITNDMFLLAGGYNEYSISHSRETFIFHTKNSSWTQAPPLTRNRIEHSTSVIKDKFTKEMFVVVSGGLPVMTEALSIEYISIKDLTKASFPHTSATWKLVENHIPFGKIHGHSTLSWNEDVLFIGGEDLTRKQCINSFHRLSLNDSIFTWNNMTQKLKVARRSFVALKIPHSLADCEC